jgi:hypothetical protein
MTPETPQPNEPTPPPPTPPDEPTPPPVSDPPPEPKPKGPYISSTASALHFVAQRLTPDTGPISVSQFR